MALQFPYLYKWTFFSEVGYTPRSGQKWLHWAADYFKYIGFFSYPRGGKSFSAAMEVAATVNENDYHCWIVAPTYQLGSKEFGYIYQAHLNAGYLDKAKHVSFNITGGDMRIEYPWGWWVEVKSAQHPHLILAEELDEMILSEAPRLPATLFDRTLFNRAEKRHGRVYCPATPMGNNWAHREFWIRAQKVWEGQPNPLYDRDHYAIRVTHLEEEKSIAGVHYQPGVYSEETVAKARVRWKDQPQLLREQFGGDFISYAGLVYPVAKVKRVSPFHIPEDWHVVLGYDHGASGRAGGMTAIPFVAWDNESPRNCYVFKMIFESGHGARHYVQQIRNKLRKDDGMQRGIDIVVVDKSAKQVRIELALLGLPNTTPPFSDFKARYTRVMSLLEEGRLFVFDSEETAPLFYEMARYEWKEGAKGEPRGDQVQGPDDAMDALGYALLYPIPEVRPEERESAAAVRTEEKVTPLPPRVKRFWDEFHKDQAEAKALEDLEDAPSMFDVSGGLFDE